jgi:hypothetical protein
MDYMPKDPTPEQKERLLQQMKNTMVISMVLYVMLSIFFPFSVSILVFLNMAIGEYKMRHALGKAGSTLDRMGHTFQQCLKMQAMTFIWPLSVHILQERMVAQEESANDKTN